MDKNLETLTSDFSTNQDQPSILPNICYGIGTVAGFTLFGHEIYHLFQNPATEPILISPEAAIGLATISAAANIIDSYYTLLRRPNEFSQELKNLKEQVNRLQSRLSDN